MAKRARQPQRPDAVPWYKRTWVVLTFVATILAGAATWLQQVRALPTEIEKTWGQFASWYYEDAAWSGLWSSFPEGHVDMEDMKLSNTDLNIVLQAGNGKLGGAISAKKICQAIPLFDFVLVEGEVKAGGKNASILLYDMIGGSRKNFARLELQREGVVMTVTPTEAAKPWVPSTVRIGQHPGLKDDKAYDSLSNFCKAERDAFFKELHKKRNLEKVEKGPGSISR